MRGSAPLLLALTLLGSTASIAGADVARPASARTSESTSDVIAGGTHWRISSKRGPIHIWIPESYNRDTAGIVVYVHGYYVDVDTAWREHRLAEQFARSRQNAMFIVPEAPSSSGDGIRWSSLSELLKAVRRSGFRTPGGHLIAVGHSGAYRTLGKWVDHRWLSQIILLDGLYGEWQAFLQFIGDGPRADQHRLLLVAADTLEGSREFARQFRFSSHRKSIPGDYDQLSRREKRSRLLLMESQFDHADIAAGGEVLPLVLRLTPLARH